MAVGGELGQALSGVNWGGGSLAFLKWPIISLIIFGVGYLIYWLMSFDVKVFIINPFKNNTIAEQDKGRLVRDRKSKLIKTFQLMKNKHDWHGSIPVNFFVAYKKSMSRFGRMIFMIRDENGELQPVKPPSDAVVSDWKGMTSSDIQWSLNEIQKGHDAYLKNGFWNQYGGAMIAIGGFAIVGVIMLVLFSELDTLAAAFNSAATKAAEALAASQVQTIPTG